MVCLSAGLQLLALCCWAQAQQRIEVLCIQTSCPLSAKLIYILWQVLHIVVIRKCSAAVVVARAQCMVSIKLVAK